MKNMLWLNLQSFFPIFTHPNTIRPKIPSYKKKNRNSANSNSFQLIDAFKNNTLKATLYGKY